MKLLRTRAWLAAAAVLLLAPRAEATKYAGEFMKIPVGARAVGMGGAFSAVADDATSPYWNPAGMVFLPYREGFLQHAEQFGSLVSHNFGGYVLPLKAKGERRGLGLPLRHAGLAERLRDAPFTLRAHQLAPRFEHAFIPGSPRPEMDFVPHHHAPPRDRQ